MTTSLERQAMHQVLDLVEVSPSPKGTSRLPKGGEMIQMDLNGHLPLRLNHHFEPLVLINHDIHPFDGEWNVMSSSFVNYRHHLMIS
jgi:hypothetical protein